MTDLTDNTIIVTGALGHLGFHISLGLKELGASVIALDINDESSERIQALEQAGVEFHRVDISEPDNIDAFFALLKKKDVPVHGLVNNAYYGEAGGLEMLSFNEFLRGIEGSAGISFMMLQKTLPFLKQTKGSVVNIASMYGMLSPDPRLYEKSPAFNNPPNYGAGKAALIQLTRYAACYLAKDSIRVNAISPGAFPNSKTQEDADFIARLEKKMPLGRIGKPEELIAPIAFLLSEGASYITGHNLVVDGGWTIW